LNSKRQIIQTIELPSRHFRFFPGDNPHGETQFIQTLDLSETALLLVDVYHAAENPQSAELVNPIWDDKWGQIIDHSLVPLISTMRDIGLPVIYVSNSSPRIELTKSAFGRRLRESLGFDPTIDFREPDVNPLEFDTGDPIQLLIPSQIAPQHDDYFIRKHTYCGFFETRLDSLLRNLGIRNIVVAGFATDVCVMFTMAGAVFRGYNTILVRDGTLATEIPSEVSEFANTQRTINWIESFLGPSTTSQDFILAVENS
jgi:nicotinamidase-related amidase